MNTKGLASPDKGYVLGVVGPGDGYVWAQFGEGNYRLGLHAEDEDFLSEFYNRLGKVYGKPRRHESQVVLYSKEATEDVLSFGRIEDFKEGSETVPDIIRESTERVISSYLKGFFDSQGCVDLNGRRITAIKENLEVLEEIKNLLQTLGIYSHIIPQAGSPDNLQKYHAIVVSWREELEKYANQIGFSIERKAKELKKILNSYSHTYKRWTEKEEKVMKEKYDRNTKEVAKLLNRPQGCVQAKARRMSLTEVN